MIDKIKIAAVVVLYNKSYPETDTYKSLLKSWGAPILIYDNSPKNQHIELSDSESYLHNAQNPGVSVAYNYATDWAKQKNCSHLLILDSDSKFPIDALELYNAEVKHHPNSIILPEMISANRKISPFYFKWGKSFYGDGINYGKIKLGKILAINSGTIIPLSLFDETPKFNENLPLDWSDVAFFRNLKSKYSEAQHIALNVNHGLSEHETQSLEQAIFRYTCYIKGIKQVSKNKFESLLMLFWAKLRALKFSIRYKNLRFISLYFKHLNG